MKKPFKVYYFLAYEGHTEFVIFAYIKNRFKDVFSKSKVTFREPRNTELFSNGKLNGVKDLSDFEDKYIRIKKDYENETFLFILDDDLYHSPRIAKKIKEGRDFVQFIKYNSEFMLLRLAGHELKDISEFDSNFQEFRDYSKSEFRRVYGKDLKYIINDDFLDSVMLGLSDEDIKKNFEVIFSLCEDNENKIR